MFGVQLLLLLFMLMMTDIVATEENESDQIQTRPRQRATIRRIRGRRRLALPLDTELDDDWDWTIRAPKDDPHIHDTGKAGKGGKAGSSGKNHIGIIETVAPSKDIDNNNGKGNGHDSNPSKGKGDGDASSLDDDQANLNSIPTESPSARPSHSPAIAPSPPRIGFIPHPPSTGPNQSTPTTATIANHPKDPQAPLPYDEDEESFVSNNATDGPTSSGSGMLIGVSVSSVGLIAVAMFAVKRRRRKRKRLVLTASDLEDESVRGGKRRRIVKDGVVKEGDYIDDGRGHSAAFVPSFQPPITPGPLSPTIPRVRDGVMEEDDDEEDGGSFTGVYKLREHYNLTGFLEATGVPWAIRSAAARARPVHFITHEGNNITMKFKGVPRATYIIDGPSVENVLRDRTFACKATYTSNNLGFEVEQQGVDNGDYDIRLRWTLSEDDMTVHLTMTAEFLPDPITGTCREPVMCTQIYSRIGEF